MGIDPGGRLLQPDHFGKAISFAPQVPETERILLFDPQTSGGLLIALPPPEGERLLRSFQDQGIQEAAAHRRSDVQGRKVDYRGE